MFLSLKHNPWEKFHAVFSQYHSYTSMINTAQLMNTQTLMQLKCAALLSTYLGSDPTFKVKRYDRSHPYDRPAVVGAYNENMRGIDLFDMMCTLYKRQIKCLVLISPGIKVPQEQPTSANEEISNPSRYLSDVQRNVPCGCPSPQ